MKVATFNVNSVRARMPVLLKWLEDEQPDIVGLQELKVEDAKFPFDDFAESGYHCSIHGQPRYNGVAILSKKKPEEVRIGFDDPDWPNDGRLILARFDDIWFANSYVPNGTEVGSDRFVYKLNWFKRFRKLTDGFKTSEKVLWVGDMNVAPTSDDVFEPKKHLGTLGHHPDEFKALGEAVDWGWVDCFRKFTHGPGHYTFWEYRIPKAVERGLGWRIDHIYASPGLSGSCEACDIHLSPRTWDRPSDHTPVVAQFSS